MSMIAVCCLQKLQAKYEGLNAKYEATVAEMEQLKNAQKSAE